MKIKLKKKRLALGTLASRKDEERVTTKETHLDASKNQTPICYFYHALIKKAYLSDALS